MQTSALSGTISSRFFGYKFDVDNVDMDVNFEIKIEAPRNIGCMRCRTNATLHIDIEKISMKDLSMGIDKFFFSHFKPNRQY